MLAFKFLKQGGIGPFSGYRWPLPEGGAPSPWVSAEEPPRTCAVGIHACVAEEIAYWLSAELWVIELEGELTREAKKLVAPRGRLVRRIEAWTPDTAKAFSDACILRAREVACELLRGAGEVELAAALEACPDMASIREVGERGACEGVTQAAGYVADAVKFAEVDAATSAYVAAHAPLTVEGYEAERAWQSRWLAARLNLAAAI